MTEDQIKELEVIDAIELPQSELNDFEELVDDFIDKCGYSEPEAELAAVNVLNEDAKI